ncbi:MAG: META domain-containing protein [Anaerolineae bacterium]|jgi:heat shock protein HslJ
MNSRTSMIVVMGLAVLLVGCGSSPADSSALQETRWALVTLGGDALLPGTAPSAEFSADQISGSAGCNTYFGTYDASGSEMTIGDVAHTEMWCVEPEGVMDQEQAFLAALASVTGYRLAGGRLELLDESGSVILIFEPQPAVP